MARGMKFCTTCGSKLDEGAAFCANCGLAMKAVVAPPEAPGTSPIPALQQDEKAPVSFDATTRLPQSEVKPIARPQQDLSPKVAKVVELVGATTGPETNSVHQQNAAQETPDLFAVVSKSEKEGKRARVPVWAWVLIAVVILAGIGGLFLLYRPKQSAPQIAQPSTPTMAQKPSAKVPAGLTMTAVANMNYHVGDALSELGEKTSTIKLVDGKGSFGDWNAFLDKGHIAFGDLDGDGIDDAAVVLTFEGPGSAAPQVLVAVTNRSGQGESMAVRRLGYNAVIKSMNISGGAITVEMLTVGPNDPMCCPATRQVLRLTVQRNEFVAD
jgi:hypothetical protein